ncbi:MAG: hypothetical protein ACI808_003188 [Paraglaciecola sp.]|jgi:hypothetical protein
MNIADLLELALSLNSRLDNHWTLFVSIHLALLGGVIYIDRPLRRNEKIVAVLIYSGFALVNYMMMRNAVIFLDRVYLDILALKNEACCINSNVVQHVVNLYEQGSTSQTLMSIVIVHIIMYLLTVIVIINDKVRSKVEDGEESEEIGTH